MMSTEGYRKTVLDNGFEVHSLNISGAQKTYTEIRVKVGSAHESRSRTGIAHYLEHMFGYGSDNYKEKDLLPFFADQGGQTNFMTGSYETFYWRYALTHKVPDFLERISDTLINPGFTEDHVDSERVPILNEEEQGSVNVFEKFFYDSMSHLFPAHRFSMPNIGLRSDIERLNLKDLRKFLAEHYQASNMFLSAAGDVDHDWLVEQANLYFGSMPVKSPTSPLDKISYKTGTITIPKDYGITIVSLGFRALPKTNDSHLQAYFSSRLLSRKIYDELRDKRKLLYGPETNLINSPTYDTVTISSSIEPAKMMEATEAVLEVLEKCATSVTKADIDVLRNNQEEELIDELANIKVVGERMASSIHREGRYIPLEAYSAALNAFTPEDVQNHVRFWLSSEPFMVVAGLTGEHPVPDISPMAAQLRSKLGLEIEVGKRTLSDELKAVIK